MSAAGRCPCGRWLRLVPALLGMALSSACIAPHEGLPDAAAYAKRVTPAQAALPGRVALGVPPQVESAVVDYRGLVRVHAGRIAGQALLAALGDSVRDGARTLDLPAAAGEGYAATVVVDAVRLAYDQNLRWFIPMPVLGAIERSEFTLSLSFDLRLLDASGRPVWARTYADHAGLLVWTSPRIGEEPLQVGLVRLANEAAWRLAQRAALDLRQWLADERYRARAL